MEIKITCDTKLYVPLENLVPFQGELKTLSEVNYQKLKKQILEEGFCAPVFVWKNDAKYYLCDGHQRTITLNKMKAEGYKIPDVPAVEIQAKTKREAKKKLLSYVSQFGKVDPKGLYQYILDAELTIEEMDDFEIPEIDMDSFKEEFFPEDKPEGSGSEDNVPEVAQNELGVQLGDIYQLGSHRLMCGDSTDLGCVEKLMNGEKAELCFTSPPYADQREYNGGKELSTQHLAKFITSNKEHCDFFAVNLGYSRKNGEVNAYWDDYLNEAKNAGLKFLSWNIWDRACPWTIGQQTAMFPIEHEWIFVFGKNARDLKRTVPNKNAGHSVHGTIREASGNMVSAKRVEVHSHRPIGTIYRGDVERLETKLHPAMFPVHLPQSYIEAFTEKDSIIYEPFCGSGSTLIACEKTNRKCYGMELDPHYCSVIIKRWEEYTGRKHKKLS